MLIASVSDLHVDFPENRDALVKLAGEIHRRGTDLLIIGGDVSHKDDRIARTLLAMKETAPVVAYIPGNHDLWSSAPQPAANPEVDTWARYRVELKALCEGVGVHYLPAAPLVMGGTAIVGTCGWYDYSFVEPWVVAEVGEEKLPTKKLGRASWSDGFMVAFRRPDGSLMSDPEVARTMEAELEAQLSEVSDRDDVNQVVAVTHHQPFREVVYRTGSLPWEFFCAFMGSEGLGRVIRRAAKVRTVIFGHSHIVDERTIHGLRVYGTALGYPRERRGLDEAATIRTRIGWISV